MMIRALALLLGLALGLAVAGVVYGQMSHLRLAANLTQRTLPAWTDAVTADAGVLQGQAGASGAVLHWRLSGLDAGGPVWTVRIRGAGLALGFDARIAANGLGLDGGHGEAVLTGAGPADGGLAGEGLAGHFTLARGIGRLQAEGLALDLTALGQRMRRGDQDVPDGRAVLSLSFGGGWTLALGDEVLRGDTLAELLGLSPG